MVGIRYDPDGGPLRVFAVEQDQSGEWHVQYGQPGPEVVMSAVFDTEDEAWGHATANGFPRPPDRYPVTEQDSE